MATLPVASLTRPHLSSWGRTVSFKSSFEQLYDLTHLVSDWTKAKKLIVPWLCLESAYSPCQKLNSYFLRSFFSARACLFTMKIIIVDLKWNKNTITKILRTYTVDLSWPRQDLDWEMRLNLQFLVAWNCSHQEELQLSFYYFPQAGNWRWRTKTCLLLWPRCRWDFYYYQLLQILSTSLIFLLHHQVDPIHLQKNHF